MNKKVYFILFPLFALLFSFSGKAESDLYFSYSATQLNSSVQSLAIIHPIRPDKELLSLLKINKQEHRKLYSPVRTKALNSALAADICSAWVSVLIIQHCVKQYLGFKESYALSVSHPSYSLRGPPQLLNNNI